jgi:hypothetical protein
MAIEVQPLVTIVGSPLERNTSSFSVRVQEWPTEIKGGLAWEPSSFASEHDCILVLTDDEITEVQAALEHFNSRCSELSMGSCRANRNRSWFIRE